MRRWAYVGLILGFATLVGCRTTEPQQVYRDVQSPDVLRVGVTPNYPPIIYKQKREIVGLEADMAHALAADLGKRVVFVELPLGSLIPALREDRIDIIMSGISVTSGRSAMVSFADPYLQVGQLILVRTTDAMTYQYPEVIYLIEARIGVEKGSTGDMLVRRRCGLAKRVTFSSAEKASKALANGKIDVVVHDAPVIWHMAAMFEADGLIVNEKALTEEYLAWAVAHGNTNLLQSVNASLESWRENDRLYRMLSAWVPMR